MALILLHAIGLDAGSWTFAKIADAKPLDLPGFGGQPLPQGGLHLGEMADDIVRRGPDGLLEIVGVSMGAQVSMQIGLRHPSRVRSIVLANSGPAADPKLMRQRAEAVSAEGPAKHAETNISRWFSPSAIASSHPAVAYVRECITRDSSASLRAGWLAIAGHDVRDRLGDLQMPVTVLSARDDKAAPVDVLQGMQRQIPHSRLVTIDGPHLAYMEVGDKFREAVLDHLRWASTF